MNVFSKLFLAAALFIPAQQVQAFDKAGFCLGLFMLSGFIAHMSHKENKLMQSEKLDHVSSLCTAISLCSAAGFYYFARQKQLK